MAAKGLSLIFISHKLHEVLAAADRVVVLRGGKVVAERKAADTTRAELAELMVGRRVARPVRKAGTPGAVILEAIGVHVGRRLTGVDLTLRAGETLGIIGVSGNGQTALANATTNCFPMILISGSSEREIVDLQQGDYEEMDQLAIAKPLCKIESML
jgi:simple sugar transport system ATP-binding protein